MKKTQHEVELAPVTETATKRSSSPATARAWIIGLLLIPVLVFWVEYTEIVASGPDLAAMSLPMAAVFALLTLIALNHLLRRWKPRAALTQAELLLIYSMNTVAVYISGIGMMQFLNPTLVGWRYYATPQNGWAKWLHQVKPWAVPAPDVIPDYYAGRSSFFTPDHLAGWAGAIAVWTAFILVLLFCMYCISTLMRRQWVENERLLFPIVQIPLEITNEGGATPLWRNRLLWLGIGLAAVLESMATIHASLIPTFPYFPLKPEASLRLDPYVTTSPWNNIGFTTLAFYPLVIGLSFLLSLEVSFSCWFFYLFGKVETVAATAFGFREAGAGPALARLPYTTEQGAGAFLGLALFSLWLARPHLKAAWRQARQKNRSEDGPDEPLSYRMAFLGLIASILLLIGFGASLGLSPLTSAIFFTLFLLLALAMTRIRAEAGLPWGPGGQASWIGAHGVLAGLAGTRSLTAQELTALSFLHWSDTDARCLTQPAEIEAMKLASSAQPRPLNPRHLTAAIFAAALVGILASWASCLGIYYHYGAASAHVNSWRTGQGHYPFDELQGWLNNPKPVDGPRIAGTVAGAVVVGLLSLLRIRFFWWPLHPIGYAIGNTDTMAWIWFPTLLGWLAKSLILRYGSVRVYRQALPFFLGLVLGDYVVSCLWSLYFLVTGTAGYKTFPI